MTEARAASSIATQPQGALHDYEILDTVEAGHRAARPRGEVAARGQREPDATPTRSLRRGEAFLVNAHIEPVRPGGPRRIPRRAASASCCSTAPRSRASAGRVAERGFTLVPLALYFKDGAREGRAGLARGKKQLRQARDDPRARAATARSSARCAPRAAGSASDALRAARLHGGARARFAGRAALRSAGARRSSEPFRPTRFDYDAFRASAHADEVLRAELSGLHGAPVRAARRSRKTCSSCVAGRTRLCRCRSTSQPPSIPIPRSRTSSTPAGAARLHGRGAGARSTAGSARSRAWCASGACAATSDADLALRLRRRGGAGARTRLQVLGKTPMRDACQVTRRRASGPTASTSRFEVPEVRIYVADYSGLLRAGSGRVDRAARDRARARHARAQPDPRRPDVRGGARPRERRASSRSRT